MNSFYGEKRSNVLCSKIMKKIREDNYIFLNVHCPFFVHVGVIFIEKMKGFISPEN